MPGGVDSMEPRSRTVFAVTTATFVLASIFVGLRMLSRAWIVKRLSWDDYIMMVAWVLAFGLAFTICYGATVGLGRHERDIPDSWQGDLRTSQYAFSVLYQPALMAEKTSILAFYLTLSASNKVFRWATIATLLVVNCVGFALTMFTAFQCPNPSAAWAFPRPQNSGCKDVVTIYLSSSPVNIITDLAILILPMPILTRMRLPGKQKLILVITFSFGIFVAIVDVVRVAYLANASSARLSEIASTSMSSADPEATDFSWYSSQSFMWTGIEVNVGIMCACVPGLKPLVSRLAPHLIHDASRTQDNASFGNTAQMIEDHRVPTFVGESVTHRDFAPPSPVGRRNTRPQPLGPDAGLDMVDFLTTPGMPTPPSPTTIRGSQGLNRSDSVVTMASGRRPVRPTFFDFVDPAGSKSMIHMTNRESIFPIAIVTFIFFLWGCGYGLLDVLNQQFQVVGHMSAGQGVAMHSAYYAGYIIGPLTIGRLVLKNWGFKACYSVGLAIYACGTLVFWVAAVLTSFPAYIIVNVIVGVGLSVLETGANPFIALCGPQEYGEIRLNLSQGFQAIGTVLAPLIAAKGFTKYSGDALPSLINTQWAYLGIALFTIAIAFGYYYVPLPGVTDAELEEACQRPHNAHLATVPVSRERRVRIVWPLLALGVAAIFTYVGAQEVLATGFDVYLDQVRPGIDAVNTFAIAHAAFAASRFLAAGLGFLVRPRALMLAFFVLAILFSALSTLLQGDAALAVLILAFAAEGPLFSLIFAQALRGQGRFTKDAAACLASAIGGGGVFTVFSYLASSGGEDARRGNVVAVAAFSAGAVYPLVLCAWPAAGRIVDPWWGKKLVQSRKKEGEAERKGSTMGPPPALTLQIPTRPSTASGSAESKGRRLSSDEKLSPTAMAPTERVAGGGGDGGGGGQP